MNTWYDPQQQCFTTLETPYPVDEETKNAISASLTGGGEVWIEDGKIRTSGAAPSPAHTWQNGAWQENKTLAAQHLQEAKAYKLHAAAEAAQAFIETVAGLDGVPQFERDSWAQQSLEAQAWAADKSAATPILAGIAQARGVPLDDLRAKALAKSNAYTALTASVAGQRQALEDQIRAAETLAALDAIAVAYRPPMMPMMPAAKEGK